MGKVLFSQVSVCPHPGGRGTYLGWGGGTYLGWRKEVATLDGGGGGRVPTLYGRREYLPWIGGGGTYLGWGGEVPTLDRGEWVPTLDGGGILTLG